VVEQPVKAYAKNLLRLTPTLLLLLVGAACSNTDLGQIDETLSERDDMPGPGVFAQDDGQPALSWSSDSGSDEPTAAAAQPASTSTASTAATATAATDKAEFEQFNAWNELRSKGRNSAEYREFQQWLEYQKFKAAE
jgi:hypothetical protein